MHCVRCGRELAAGSPLCLCECQPQADATPVAGPASNNTLPAQGVSPAQEHVPLALASLAVAAAFCSVGFVSGYTAAYRLPLLFVALIVTFSVPASLWLYRSCWKQWRPTADVELPASFFRIAVFFAVLLLLVGGGAGWLFGGQQMRVRKVIDGIRQLNDLETRVVTARHSKLANLRDQFDMFATIEPHVTAWRETYRDLAPLLDGYDSDYPDAHKETASLMNRLKLVDQRMQLLQREIAISREIAKLNGSSQLVPWIERMEPLIDDEQKLIEKIEQPKQE